MGKLNIKISHNGKIVNEAPFQTGRMDVYRDLNKKYNFDRLIQLDFEGDDINLELEIDDISDDNIWDKIQNEQLLELIDKVVFKQSIENQLSRISSEIEGCGFNDKYEIDRLGKQAIKILQDIPESKYEGDKELVISRIRHTLSKEVKYLTFLKDRDSQRRKDETVEEAIRQLTYDINSSTNAL